MQQMQESFFNIYDVDETLFKIACRECDNKFRTFVMLKKHIQCAHGCFEENPEGSLQYFLQIICVYLLTV